MSNNLNTVLSSQNQTQSIIDDENTMIDAKEETYQNIEFGKERVLQLNQNFQERTTAFNWIVSIFFITLAFVVFLLFLKKIIPGTDGFVNPVIGCVLLIGIAYCIYLYFAFLRRDPTDYNQVIHSHPIVHETTSTKKVNVTPVSTTLPKKTTTAVSSTTTSKPVNSTTTSKPVSSTTTSPPVSSTTTTQPVSSTTTSQPVSTTTPVPPAVINNLKNVLFNPDKTDKTVVKDIAPCSSGTSLGTNSYTGNAGIPKLITNEIYLGPYGRLTILVVSSTKFTFYNLNISKDIFTSYDGVHFKDMSNPNLTATVITDGPTGPMNQNINGKGIMLSVGGIENYYFYSSKFPALLLTNDIFIGPNATTQIKVLNQNQFILVNPGGTNSTNSTDIVIRTYHSTNGTNFFDIGNPENLGTVVVDGPSSSPPSPMYIYGQAIRLTNSTTGEDTYFYYNGNTSPPVQNEISTASLNTASTESGYVSNDYVSVSGNISGNDMYTSIPYSSPPQVTKTGNQQLLNSIDNSPTYAPAATLTPPSTYAPAATLEYTSTYSPAAELDYTNTPITTIAPLPLPITTTAPTTTLAPVAAPTNLKVVHNTDANGMSYLSQVIFSWTASIGSGITYYWSYSGSGTGSGNTTSTSKIITGLKSGGTYTFAVYASTTNGANSPTMTTTFTLSSISGGNASTNGSYPLYTFTTSNTLKCTGNITGNVLIVGGGGAGGVGTNGLFAFNRNGGGGGGGGVGMGVLTFASGTGYTITIGAGGKIDNNNNATDAESTTITGGSISEFARKGGYGGGATNSNAPTSGGSGGGACVTNPTFVGTGTGGTGSLKYYGNDGGPINENTASLLSGGGGGGGANGVGGTGNTNTGGNGGNGIKYLDGVYYGAGGGGGAASGGTKGTGGNGGGGDGGDNSKGTNATGYGNGGGGGSINTVLGSNNGGNGSSGIVIVAFLT